MSGSCASRSTVVLAGDLVTAPASGRSSPASTLSRVDLPTPFGAMIPMRSAEPMLRLTPSSTTRLPTDMLTLTAASLDIGFSRLAAGRDWRPQGNAQGGAGADLAARGI